MRAGGRSRVRVVVRGLVQGVFFRDSTRRRAVELGLSGSVRNLRDGSVEIVAEGEAAAVDALLDWARQGPPSASVSGLDVLREEPLGDSAPFTILRGA